MSLVLYKLSRKIYLCFSDFLNSKYQKILMLVPGKLALPHEKKISGTWYTIAINIYLNLNHFKNIAKVQRHDLFLFDVAFPLISEDHTTTENYCNKEAEVWAYECCIYLDLLRFVFWISYYLTLV